jgi:hypothetical protein
MRGEVSNTTDGVTLNLDIRAEHLADKRLKAAELDN